MQISKSIKIQQKTNDIDNDKSKSDNKSEITTN